MALQTCDRKILALGAHPDDVEFGCGGMLRGLSEKGNEIYLYVATYGQRGGDPEVRESEAKKAAKLIPARQIFWGGFADCEVPSGIQLIESLEDTIFKVKPDFVMVNSPGDTHQDHRALAIAAQSAARRVPNLLFYETPTSIQFSPSIFFQLKSIANKLELLECHRSQIMRTNVNGFSIMDLARATATHRGMEITCPFAEAFSAVRVNIS